VIVTRAAKLPFLLVVVLVLATLLLAVVPAAAATKTVNNWAAATVTPLPGKKMLVLAKISDDVAKRSLEDAVVAGLKQKGIEAIPAYTSITEADLVSVEAIRKKAEELGVSAGIAYTVTDQGEQVVQKPHASVSIGIGGYGGGGFGGFLGTSVPLGGGATTVHYYEVKGELLLLETQGPQWIGTYSTDVAAGAQNEAAAVASLTIKGIKKAGFFKVPKK